MAEFDIYKEIGPLMEAYAPAASASKQHVMGGRYMSNIDAAHQVVQNEWTKTFGAVFPAGATKQPYTLSYGEDKQIREQLFEVYCAMDKSSKKKHHIYGRGDVASKGAAIERQIIQKQLSYSLMKPRLRFRDDTMQMPPLRSNGDTDCAVAVFGMNLLGVAEAEKNSYADFSSRSLRSFMKQYAARKWEAEQLDINMHDLQWMMGSLATPYATRRLAKKIGVITTIGADFQEINDNIISRLKTKRSDVSFGVSTVLSSDNSEFANHVVTINNADGKTVNVNDPNFSEPVDMSAKEFWNRWTPTNMQAVVTVSHPI